MEYYLSKSGDRYGPMSLDQVRAALAAGTYQTTDLVWTSVQTDWMPIGEHPDFSAQSPAAPAFTEARSAVGAPLDRPLEFPAELNSMYEAFIGPTKAPYYLPIFERFDSGGSSLSWNWPAAFFTQFWMLYRGMFLWGFLWYPILSFLASLLIVVPLVMISPGAGQRLSYLITWPVSFIVMGLFSNRLLHEHVRKMIQRSGKLGLSDQRRREWLIRKGANNGMVILLVVFMTSIGILGILAAIAIPAYQGYITRAKVVDGLSHMTPVKAAYSDYLEKNQRSPDSIGDLGFAQTDPRFGASVSDVRIDAQHQLQITLKGAVIDGKTLTLAPTVAAHSVVWACSAENIPRQYVPPACRR